MPHRLITKLSKLINYDLVNVNQNKRKYLSMITVVCLPGNKYNFPSEWFSCFFEFFRPDQIRFSFRFLVSFKNWHTIVIQSMTTTLHVKIALQKIYAVFFVRTITPGRGCGVHWLKRLHTTTQLLLLFHSTAVHLKTLLNGLSQRQQPLLATQARDSRSWPGGEVRHAVC